jgi:hypothetical protein
MVCFASRVFCVNGGYGCGSTKSPGALVKGYNLNSTCDLQNLVKSVENRRKIRKKLSQFFGFFVKYTTFVILA